MVVIFFYYLFFFFIFRYGVSGFPTIKFFPKDNKDGEEVNMLYYRSSVTMCSSRKYPYPPHGRGGGFQKPYFLKESMTLKWNYHRGGEGGGFKLKNLPWEGFGYFLEQHNFALPSRP